MVLVDKHGPPQGDFGDITFTSYRPGELGDAYLCWGDPTPTLLTFPGPRAWYITEPITHRKFTSKQFRFYERNRSAFAFLHHSKRADSFVPMHTHYVLDTVVRPAHQRIDAVVAVVSNHGGRFWRLKPGERARNQLILDRRVKLFGAPDSWNSFRRWPWSAASAPSNYAGGWPANHLVMAHLAQLAEYRVSLCMENASTDMYFSEKFVNSVRAGCVPIYHAHPSVKATFLQGAAFVDPADYEFDPQRTIAAAMSLDHGAVADQNYAWLSTDIVKSTGNDAIWKKIAKHFSLLLSDFSLSATPGGCEPNIGPK